jgi:hypothetical protein
MVWAGTLGATTITCDHSTTVATGARFLVGSKSSLGYSTGENSRFEPLNNKVYPSGAAAATAIVPVVVPAPVCSWRSVAGASR